MNEKSGPEGYRYYIRICRNCGKVYKTAQKRSKKCFSCWDNRAKDLNRWPRFINEHTIKEYISIEI